MVQRVDYYALLSRAVESLERRHMLGCHPAGADDADAHADTLSAPAAPAFPTPPSKKLSDTSADFVVGFDPKPVPPLAFERARLAFRSFRHKPFAQG